MIRFLAILIHCGQKVDCTSYFCDNCTWMVIELKHHLFGITKKSKYFCI